MQCFAFARRRGLLVAATAAMLASLPAAAQPAPGAYVVGGAGLSLLEDSRTGGSTTEFDPGWTGLGGIGYAFSNGFRVEGELGFRRNDVDNGPGRAEAWSVMGNAIYDVHTGTRFTPYVGVGVGGARLNFDNVPAGGASVADKDTVLAYQGLAGVGYQLGSNLTLDLGYRYFATESPSFRTSAGTSVDADYDDHAVMLGLRYRFGE